MAILCSYSNNCNIINIYFGERNMNFLRILFWIFVIITFGMILTRIFGHSATDLQIFFGILSIFFTSITDLYRRMGRMESDIKQIKDAVVKKD